jgi:hypothetical protein
MQLTSTTIFSRSFFTMYFVLHPICFDFLVIHYHTNGLISKKTGLLLVSKTRNVIFKEINYSITKITCHFLTYGSR